MRENISTTQIQFPMSDTPQPVEVRENVSAGHLSVHIEGAHPVDVPFLFERPQEHVGPAAGASLAAHVLVVLVIFLLVKYAPRAETSGAILPDKPNDNIIWLSEPGPGGGGGGGGNRMKDPPRQAELPGKDKITVPVEKPPKLEAPQQIAKNEPPPEQLNIPAMTLAASKDTLPGAIAAPPGPPTLSQGSGTGGGSGTGAGTGIGPGTGSGLGPGSGGGTGGGVYHPGNGVTQPQLLHEVKPAYTSDAMRAKVQGSVWVETIVQKDGSVGDVQVIRSLDPTFGLDQEAVKAAKQWRFRPCTRQGEAVACVVSIELTFTLR